MEEMDIATYAKEMFHQHGAKAVAIAAQRARAAKEDGSEEDTKKWLRVQAALTEMRGPPES